MSDAPSLLAKLDELFDRVLYFASGLLLLTIACAVFYAVTARYVFNEPPLWADEAPRAFFLWMTYIGIAVATRRGQNIRVTHFIDQFPPMPRLILEVVMHVLVLIMLAAIVWYNQPVIQLQAGGKMLSTGWSFVWLYAPLSIGCALMLFYQFRLLIKSFADYQLRVSGGAR
jgi:TRAP-type C4-dicarboxylate transport system permease small subunit